MGARGISVRRAGWLRLTLLVCCLHAPGAAAQTLTGTLIGTVTDEQGQALPGARVRITSDNLIGGPTTQLTDARGHWRFFTLPPGSYVLEVERTGFATHRLELVVGAGATVERNLVLKVAIAEAVVVDGTAALVEARGSGFETRFRSDYLTAIPTRRSSLFDPLRASPGVSPTSPSSGTVTTVSVFGSATGENLFLIDGTNTTCPCNGIARAELGVDFIGEVHVQSIGASVEFGSLQGAVFNVVTRQGSDRFRYDAAYYGQPPGLTSQPVRLPSGSTDTGYERAWYRDFTTNLGGPAIRQRLWFFGGYQHLRDADSQPGTDPDFPRIYEQDKFFGKLTWRLSPSIHLSQSVHTEVWDNPDAPTLVTPFEATRHRHATVPAVTFGHLTHLLSPSTVWEARVGRFVYDEERVPSTGDWTIPSHFDRLTNVTSNAPPLVGGLRLTRTSVKATISHYRPGWLRADHQWKLGAEVERGTQQGANVIPTGVRFVDSGGRPFQAISSAPSNTGGMSVTIAGFASDEISIGNRMTLNAGLRFDHARAVSQDLHVLDAQGQETEGTIKGLGTMYTWNVWSPRAGVTAKLSADGRTILRASYGRYNQGVLTGEISPFHPGVTPIRTDAYDATTGAYTRLVRIVDSSNLDFDPGTRAPHTDQYSVGLDRELGHGLVAAGVYVHKRGADFIGWSDVGGEYQPSTRTLPDGRVLPVFELTSPTATQRFLLANQDDYFLTYDGVVVTVEKRYSRGWQASGSYTYSRVTGLMASSGATAAAPQASTVAAPTMVFGRDPNDLTNAVGRLPNDRPHMFRMAGIVDVPRTGLVVAASVQHFSGKPWAATAQVLLPQGDQRILLEPRGSRRLSSQTLLDLRVSRSLHVGSGRIDLLVDVLNLLNDTADEGIATDNLYSPNFGQPTQFVDPRRVMLGVRIALGR